MNRHAMIVLSGSLICALCLCHKDHDRPRDSASPDSPAIATEEPDPCKDTLYLDSLCSRLLRLQQAVIRSPSDTRAIRLLVEAAKDTATDRFFILGQAMIEPDSIGEPRHGRTRINARNDAQQWALLLKSATAGNEVRYGTPIKGKVLYIKELLEKPHGDTLRVLFMAPVGSVVVR